MTECSIAGCKGKYYAKRLCRKHYQKSDKYKQYQKQYRSHRRFDCGEAVSEAKVEKYDWIKDKKAIVEIKDRIEQRIKELKRKASE
jgi:hypothetical protein